MESMPYPALAAVTSMPTAAVSSPLLDAVAALPDPRRQASVTYPMGAMLALVLAGLLANHHSLLAIAEWATRQSPEVLTRLGLPHGRVPHQSTLHRLLVRLDPDVLATCLDAALNEVATQHDPGMETDVAGIAIDGKAQRGRLVFGHTGTPVHTVTAWCHSTGRALAHVPIAAGTDGKAEAEVTVAPAVVARLAWPGRVLTADALYCQRHLCSQVLDAGGDYLVLVKANQPRLLDDITTLFDPPPSVMPSLPLLDRREAWTIERGHGRTHDTRHLVASTDLSGYLDWPGLAQVFRLERRWHAHGREHRHLHDGITSLDPQSGPPTRLLALKRGHWGIENRLHRVKDVTFGEDASLIHVGHGSLALAYLRDTAIGLLALAGVRHIASTLRRFSQQPDAVLRLLTELPPRA